MRYDFSVSAVDTFQFFGDTFRNGLLLLDEFRFKRQSDDWIVFLKLLEDQTYARKLGVFSSTINLQDGDLYLRQENGQIEMKTRFATVLATMRDFKRVSSQEFKAFVNRRITYEYNPTLDELEKKSEQQSVERLGNRNQFERRCNSPSLRRNHLVSKPDQSATNRLGHNQFRSGVNK